ncbi:MAG TPA: sigma-70 family RNA polymerase sigma factor [Xanthobacteraceae bacterium]|nr:sigma-70 family RNA polymerase sigma factor [Xanthobacteraceae bacterium]
MDHEHLVRRASGGDVEAFVDLTRRFQHFAFGSALALVRDFQHAEDVVQEAFVAAWSALPGLADPAAFPGWLRGIVRHQAFRMLRRRQLRTVPLAEAEELPSDEPPADHRLAQRQHATAALAAITELPDKLREPATLFFVYECSHQDIATFLGLPVATVNNRLHAARSKLKERMLTMVTETLHSRALPDDFANRIGRLVEARGAIIEALFDPNAPPDILTEIVVSDEVRRRAVNVQVVQRPGAGIVRGVAVSPVSDLARGSTVLNSGRQSEAPVSLDELAKVVPLLAGPPSAMGASKLVETGIKVIDVMCPLMAGGSVAIVGEARVGIVVVTEELVQRLSHGPDRVSLFPLVPLTPNVPPDWSFAEELKKEAGSEGTVGQVQTFFFRGEDRPWTQDRLAALSAVDTVIHLSRERIRANVYPAVDVLTSRSRLSRSGASILIPRRWRALHDFGSRRID